eukprot:UN05121
MNNLNANDHLLSDYESTVKSTASADNIEEIEIQWSEYRKMFQNVGWNEIPNSYEEANANSSRYQPLLKRIYELTDNEPTRIQTREQLIQILITSAVYQQNKDFINKHCPIGSPTSIRFDENTPLTKVTKSKNTNNVETSNGKMHDETDFIQMCDTPSEPPAYQICNCKCCRSCTV